ncbi:MAG: LysM peptidoglycan-binding domain-containing protein [Candidatus Obscuribacterales bacterium]|nr:LysM peptidoglycan-binding domain-containing protein [Steroidobacteraceae bacterium]
MGSELHKLVVCLQETCSRKTAHRAMVALGVLCLTACSHTPAKIETPATEPQTQITGQLQPEFKAPSDENDAATNDALTAPFTETEPQTAEEAVAVAVAEQNLLNRIRAGFAMNDADHINVDREVAWFARHPDYLDRTFRRAERYLFFIVEELEARKMPMELALLPIVESAFNPVALSRARAAGLWQFIPSTGRRYGLEQNHRYDGRRDVVESTRAALDYLQFLADEFDGDWHLAVAAYNSGEGGVGRRIKKNLTKGKSTDFFNLDLPRETRAYVPKLLALRRIVAEPEKYGLEFGHIANQPYFAKVELDSPIDLGVAAELADLDKEDLIALNPAYYRAVTNADGPGHLLVPVDRAERLRTGLAALSPSQRVPKIYYTVHRGDTISTVARKLGVTQAELRAANRLKNTTLRIGQELVIDKGLTSLQAKAPEPLPTSRVVSRDPSYIAPPLPVRAPRTMAPERHTVRKGETLWTIAKLHGVSLNSLAEHNQLNVDRRIAAGQKLSIPHISGEGSATLAANDARSATVQRITYVVRTGDTLSRVAAMFRVEIKDLLTWNKLRRANSIKVGQRLIMFVDDTRRSGG